MIRLQMTQMRGISTAKSQRETIFKTIQDKLKIQVNFSIKIILKNNGKIMNYYDQNVPNNGKKCDRIIPEKYG